MVAFGSDHIDDVPRIACQLTELKNRVATFFGRWRAKSTTQTLIRQWSQLFGNAVLLRAIALLKVESFESKAATVSRGVVREDHIVEAELLELLSSTVLATSSLANEASSSPCSGAIMTINNDIGQLRRRYPELESEVRSILIARTQKGTTIAELRDEYRKITGLHFPVNNNVTDFLLSIPSVSAICNEHGSQIFNVMPTEKTKHLYELILGQRSQVPCLQKTFGESRVDQGQSFGHHHASNHRRRHSPSRPLQREAVARRTRLLGSYEDNCQHLRSRFRGPRNGRVNADLFPATNTPAPPLTMANACGDHVADATKRVLVFDKLRLFINGHGRRPSQRKAGNVERCKSGHNVDSPPPPPPPPESRDDYDAHLLDFPLLGDDFFLYLARMELHCKFKQHEKVLQSGLCVSGQTIGAATRRLKGAMTTLPPDGGKMIVNIGSVDVMQGWPLVQIEHDFRTLIAVMRQRGLVPVLTTLAPLANFAHLVQVKSKVERFNDFIKRAAQDLQVIDIWSCLVNDKHQTLFDCFQSEPRSVTGTSEPHVFWNKIGRQRVLQMIESNIEY